MDKDRLLAEVDRALEILSKRGAELRDLPGVIMVGVGPERRDGKLTGRGAIVLTVREKLSKEALSERGLLPFPEEVDGILVDVVVFDKPQEAAEVRLAQVRAAEVVERVKDQWLQQCNVTGIGVGYKKIGGERSSTVAVVICVQQKLPPADLTRLHLTPVPKEIDGVPTDIMVLPKMKPCADPSGSRADLHDPLVGGVSIGVANSPFSRGTFGAIVFDRDTGEQRVLSNEHVLDASIGEDVIQPAPVGLDDSIQVGFQLDICNPLHFFRLDTPNTPLGTLLAGGAVGALIAAALSDDIDPHRRGQDATAPPPGAVTHGETVNVALKYHEMPIPGTPFAIGTKWTYTRRTDRGDFTHEVAEDRRNGHVLRLKYLWTDKLLYRPGEKINVYAILQSADRKKKCASFHPVALLAPTDEDRVVPVILRNTSLDNKAYLSLLRRLRESNDPILRLLPKDEDELCFYAGRVTVGQGLPLGKWKHYLYVQSVNNVPPGTPALEAARTIGGLPVSQNTKPTLDVACGPFVYEDGQFDIELI